ncbi:MAG: hypothetical protein JW932_19640 [Deltaproteobacteria bacterium]|nr:hypothetical protein [Deltaproteobacteria bacterium]
MRFFQNIIFSMFVSLFTGFFCLMIQVPNSRAENLPLDEETVFCIYYGLSGEEMNEEDMEDLTYELGRSSFTAHKPSEMFTKSTLLRLKEDLMERARTYNEETLFVWNMQCTVSRKKGMGKYPGIILEEDSLPQPTPFIRSGISRKGQSILTGRIQSVVASRPNVATSHPLDIIVYLRPEKIDYQYDKRNVAREEMILPIRYVIFQPVKVKLFDEIVAIEKNNR